MNTNTVSAADATTQGLVQQAALAAGTTAPTFTASSEHAPGDLVTEEVSFNIDLPLCLAPADPDQPSTKWQVKLHSRTCLECDALVSWGDRDGTQAPCHFLRGNMHCPAAQIAVVSVGPRVKAARLLARARAASATNPMALAECLVMLNQWVASDRISTDDLAIIFREAGITG